MLPLFRNQSLRTYLKKPIKLSVINQRDFHQSATTSFPFVGLSKGSKRLNDLTYHYYKPTKDSPDAKLAPIKPVTLLKPNPHQLGMERRILKTKRRRTCSKQNFAEELSFSDLPRRNRRKK